MRLLYWVLLFVFALSNYGKITLLVGKEILPRSREDTAVDLAIGIVVMLWIVAVWR